MNVGGVNNQAIYNQPETLKKTEETSAKAESKAADNGVVYEPGNSSVKKATYSINMQNATNRAAIVEQMKKDLQTRKNQLSDIVSQMLSGQAGTSKLAQMFTPDKLKDVSEADIAQAKEDISEDGYWGVKQTSQRMFDFASALAGDDEEKMKEMQAAMEKGFKEATKAWGQDLPSICGDTMDAANKLFEDYYASKRA